MSYDDLAMQGFSSSAQVIRRCHFCIEDVRMSVSSNECPTCGRKLENTLPEDEAKSGPHNEIENEGVGGDEVAGWFGQFVPFMMGGDGAGGEGGANETFLRMAHAQRGMDLDTIMSSLLNSESKAASPSSEAFRKGLVEIPLKPTDFVQVVVQVEGIRRALFPTSAAYGPSFVDRHDAKKKASENLHFKGKLVLGKPIHGDRDLQAEAKGVAAVCRRGKVTFLSKTRAAQAADVAVLIVCQSDDVWPYVMTDKTNSNSFEGVTLPTIMLSLVDGNNLVELIEDNARKDVGVEISTRDRTISCPVCQEECPLAEKIVRLPCLHMFHKGCIMPWLEKKNTCPLCRYEFPTEEKKDAQSSKKNLEELHNNMFD